MYIYIFTCTIYVCLGQVGYFLPSCGIVMKPLDITPMGGNHPARIRMTTSEKADHLMGCSAIEISWSPGLQISW